MCTHGFRLTRSGSFQATSLISSNIGSVLRVGLEATSAAVPTPAAATSMYKAEFFDHPCTMDVFYGIFIIMQVVN